MASVDLSAGTIQFREKRGLTFTTKLRPLMESLKGASRWLFGWRVPVCRFSSPFCGIYAFLHDVIAWLRKHRDFVASHFHDAAKRRRGRQKRRSRKPKNEPQEENKSEEESETPDSNDTEE